MKKIIALILVLLSLGLTLDVSAATYRNRRILRQYHSNNIYNSYTYTPQYQQYQQPQVVYVYQAIPSTPISTYGSYPGCSRPDIIIGGQIWAGCNALDRNIGSSDRSGWFFANDLQSSFASTNGQNQALVWQGKTLPQANWGDGPCAPGYRLPMRGEWETVSMYARQNSTSVANLLGLPQNGAYRGHKDSNSDVRVEYRYDVAGAYWSSTVEYNGGYYPVVMHLGAPYGGYTIDGTNYSYTTRDSQWQYTNTGLELIAGTASELANIRCIKK